MASLTIVQPKRDPVFYWVALALAAFVLLPSYGLEYGLLDSMPEEILDAYGWSGFGQAWVWFLLPLVLLIRPRQAPERADRQRSVRDVYLVCAVAAVVFLLAWYFKQPFGYSVIVLYVALGAILALALARLEWMGGDRFLIGSMILVIIGVVAMFIIVPTLFIFKPMLFDENTGAFAPLQFINTLTQPYIIRVITNSLFVSTCVGLTATFFGLVCAIYTTRIAVRTVFLGRFFSILPTVTPPFVVGMGATFMLGRSGYVTQILVEWFGFEQNWLYGATGIWIAQVLAFAPMSFMLLDGAIKSISPSVEEASYTLRAGRWQTFLYVFLPLLRPALANSFLIVFVQSMADFSNPIVVGGSYDVLATQIYFFIVGSQLNWVGASVLGTVLLGFSLAVFVIQYVWIGQRSYVTVSGKAYRGEVQGLPKSLEWIVMGLLAFWIVLTLAMYGNIVYGGLVRNWGVDHTFTLNNYAYLFGSGFESGAWPTLLSTMTYAGIAAPLTAFVGLLIAYIVVRQNFHGKRALEFATMISFAVPGTVAGVSYILAFNHAPILITGTAAIVVLSMMTRNIPVGIRSGVTGLGQLDKSLDEASLSLRAGTFRTMIFVLLPLLRPALLSALVYSFVRAMTTVSAIIFLVTPDTRTATAFILNRVEDGEYGVATAYGTMLIVVMMLVIILFDWLVGESRTSRSKAKKTV
ncbi:MAG: iron ABC transporter permease [Methylobacteriaceae bacterium]|jgi:iron(III) transport system permease protein|nr:iron ABC transporter permease [Methylobacteriaceae bacterium]